MQSLLGLGVSKGLAMGPAVVWKQLHQKLDENFLGVAAETDKLNQALNQSKKEIAELVEKLSLENRQHESEIFSAHLMMVDDPEVIDQVTLLIQQSLPAAQAYQKTIGNFIASLEAIDDDYLKNRATDLRDICSRVIGHLTASGGFKNIDFPDNAVLICEDLTPSQTASLDLSKVKGVITRVGSQNSHTAILARAREIPAVLGVENIFEYVQAGFYLALDGESGEVFVNPNETQSALLQQKLKHLQSEKKRLSGFKNQPAVTEDGHRLTLAANIGNLSDVPSVLDNGAEAVGLYRTEFLFLDKHQAPTEIEQFEIYQKIFQSLTGKEIFIRTIDIGGDKKVPFINVGAEENPFLGNRAVRMCLRDLNLFKTQLRAILRAAQGYQIGIMIPMITNIAEIKACKELIQNCTVELTQQGHAVSSKIQFGVMIEVPAAALLMDKICQYVDFVSIGTNDLTQYVCAVDRMNMSVKDLYDTAHPGFIRLMNQIIGTAKAHNVFVGICGSAAHEPQLISLWIGMGVDELSMTAQHIPETKQRISGLNYENCKKLVKLAMDCESSAEIRNLLT